MELRSLGKYRLMSRIDRPQGGGGTSFYLAHDDGEPEPDRARYLAKLLTPGAGPHAERARARFEHEVRLLEAFNHPSIPMLHAAGDQDGIAYMVVDRVDGIDLATLLGHDGEAPRALSKEIAVYIMGQLADAMRHVHGVEFLDDDGPTPLDAVHRDINPRHILLSRTGDAVLAGFSHATSRWLDPQHDDPMLGELAYMAPERVAHNGRATQKTDLFSMAVVLWEMLKGQRCLVGETDEQTRDNLDRFDIGQSSRRVSGLSSKLSEIVRKNLDRDPERRYTGAFQMLQRLAQSPEAQSAEASRAELGRLVRETVGRSSSQ